MKGEFVIVAVMPGCEMFISSPKADITDKVDGAMKFKYSVDNPEIKAAAFNRITGLGQKTGMGYWEARAI